MESTAAHSLLHTGLCLASVSKSISLSAIIQAGPAPRPVPWFQPRGVNRAGLGRLVGTAATMMAWGKGGHIASCARPRGACGLDVHAICLYPQLHFRNLQGKVYRKRSSNSKSYQSYMRGLSNSAPKIIIKKSPPKYLWSIILSIY